MKYLKEYQFFIGEEFSKNEPIPEILSAKRGVAIFLIGTSGIGKSYFVKNHIHTKNATFKDFSTDDISTLYTGDPNIYYRGVETDGGRTKNASQLNILKMLTFIETGQNFIYDTTGAGKEFTDSGFEHVKQIYDQARNFGYKIIFIHLLSTLQNSLQQDLERQRHVDPHYIQWAYAKQQGGEVDGVKVEGNIQRYKSLGPDAYYLITSIDRKYKYYKFVDGKLAKRKGDRYIVKESVDNKSEVSNIVDCMLDLIEDGYNIMFKSPIGNMTYQQYLEGGGDFHPVFKPNEALLRSQFTIRIGSSAGKFKTYDDFVKIIDEMQVVISRLSDYDWILSYFEVDSYEGSYQNSNEPKPMFRSVEYKFVRKDQKIEGDRKFDLKSFKTDFENKTGMNIDGYRMLTRPHTPRGMRRDDGISIEFSSNYYDGEFPSDLDDRFSKICDRWGFEEYDFSPGKVSFFWEET